MEAIKIELEKYHIMDSHPYVIEVYKDKKFLGYSTGQSDYDKDGILIPQIKFNNGDGYRIFSEIQVEECIDKLKRVFHKDGYIFKVLNRYNGEYASCWTDVTAEDKYKFVLYLDMDGVTASNNYIIKVHNAFIKEGDDENKDFEYRNFMQSWCLQKEAVECLNKLYDVAPYTIVLSTTRRFELGIEEWNLVYRLNGVKAQIDGRTSKISKENYVGWREDEIEEYHSRDRGLSTLKNLPLIIIDDDKFDLMKYEDKLINVKTETGLTMEYFNEIIQKLKEQGVDINE